MSGCKGCSVTGFIVMVVYALTTLISLYAAYSTHFLPGGFIAGTPEGSLALLTVLFSLHMFVKALKCCCPCKKDGACGTGGGCCK